MTDWRTKIERKYKRDDRILNIATILGVCGFMFALAITQDVFVRFL